VYWRFWINANLTAFFGFLASVISMK